MSLPRPLAFLLLPLVVASAAIAGCGEGADAGGSSGRIDVVAAEDFWGSIAEQLGGEEVEVTNIITNPAADPHDYEPNSEDAREMAAAEVAIVNGIGYDQWAQKLIDANPSSGRRVLDVGDLLGLEAGDNPHQWYSPTAVHRVIGQITADYTQADPDHAAYFEQRRRQFEAQGLDEYDDLIAQIKARYAGTPVGASESIFEPLAEALGLKLITPPGFFDAVAEGTEPSPGEKAETDAQIEDGEIAVWVYNSQNATPDVQRLNDAAAAAGVPVATVTETLTPEGASFQAWMLRQLRGLEQALARSGKG
ncbi:MAG TPA: zinc ABC transporter substrate-binding protein [Solirubrobacterales bacterium]|nr:zinc ABC transporter substrate-binding protein [Solirubrobacterales bacterium]